MSYQTPFDIGTRALQHLGVPAITAFSGSRNADQAGFLYDKVRRAELRANPWNFSRRRAVLRQLVSPSYIISFGSWANTAIYAIGDIVSRAAFNGTALWVALAATTGAMPENGYPWIEYTGATTVPLWVLGAYYAGELTVSGSVVYLSLVNANADQPPTSKWHKVQGATATGLTLLSPVGYTTNVLPASSKNIFSVPPAYLRNMMQDPKTKSNPAPITTGGSQTLDYEIEQGFLLAGAPGPIIFRFGADLWLVPWFDDMFCEMMALRMALGLTEIITQSPQKLVNMKQLYDDFLDRAVKMNAIEAGSTEPNPIDTKMSRNPALEALPQAQLPQQGRQR